VIGSLLLHIAVKLPLIREGLSTKLTTTVAGVPPGSSDGADLESPPEPESTGISRRGVLVATGAGVGLLVAVTAGNTVTPLRSIALLAPRQPDKGPLHVPINRTAAQASTAQVNLTKLVKADGYRLTVMGPKPYLLTVAEIEALPTVDHVIPLACVEGWSVSARWIGPTLLSLVERAGGGRGSTVEVMSVEANGIYRHSHIFGPQLAGAILATHLNGERLTLDHGYPIRLIAPDRAGVLNTKWLRKIEIT